MDANLAAATTKQIQLDLASAESTVIAWEQQHRTVRSLSASDVAAALDHAGDLAKILKDAEREARARLYRTLGLSAAPRPGRKPGRGSVAATWWRGPELRVSCNVGALIHRLEMPPTGPSVSGKLGSRGTSDLVPPSRSPVADGATSEGHRS